MTTEKTVKQRRSGDWEDLIRLKRRSRLPKHISVIFQSLKNASTRFIWAQMNCPLTWILITGGISDLLQWTIVDRGRWPHPQRRNKKYNIRATLRWSKSMWMNDLLDRTLLKACFAWLTLKEWETLNSMMLGLEGEEREHLSWKALCQASKIQCWSGRSIGRFC